MPQTIEQQIDNMWLGDTLKVEFPNGFEVEYTHIERVETKELAQMRVYYWDEPDHRIKDFYLYDKQNERFAKIGELTPESQDKVWDFLRSA